MNYYLDVLKKYAQFSGRAARKEFWMFYLFNVIISIVLSIVTGLISGSATSSGGGINFLVLIYSLAVLIPSLAVGARRLHDTNKSGWWQLITFIPVIGAIVLIVFFVTDSQAGSNKYGANPKGK